MDPWNVQTEDDFDVGETVSSSMIGFERHEESSRTMPSQANVSLREMIRSFQMSQEDENDVVVADSESASESEPEPEGDEMCRGILHAEIRGTVLGGAAHHHADPSCQPSWIYFPSHPMTTMIAADFQGNVPPMYVTTPQMPTYTWPCQRRNEFICSASTSAWGSPDVRPRPSIQPSIQSSPPELSARTRCVASSRIAHVNGEQKVLCPKSCNRGGKGNTRRKIDYAWRIGEENGEKCLMREDFFQVLHQRHNVTGHLSTHN